MGIWRTGHRSAATGIAALVGVAFAIGLAQAQDKPEGYPERPINLVVVYPAGGGMDVTARTFAKNAETVTGHRYRVENRVGGGGLVGHTYLAKQARPDGYTVAVIAPSFFFNDALVRGGAYEAADLEPLVFLNYEPLTLIAKSGTDVAEGGIEGLIEAARASPGDIKVGVVPGSMIEYFFEWLERDQGIEFTKVPYQGGKPATNAVVSGDIDLYAAFFAEAEQFIRSGELDVLAVTDNKPYAGLPDTPPLSQAGLNVAGDTWGAARIMALPAGVPDDVKAYLAAAFVEVLENEQTIEDYAEIGLALEPRGIEGTTEAYEKIHNQMEELLREAGRLAN
ncbi:Bug family tripartite tricarboxylate transporter substrate binding protein [Acuticoccus sp.]|uniref:Bug family tripartite tricarboxylate transporter substrate binding protein n=1 Tax=Acuticoccus sp. TaxID=1904378 RepID=UPI003B516C3B